jgi:hypothetical protein
MRGAWGGLLAVFDRMGHTVLSGLVGQELASRSTQPAMVTRSLLGGAAYGLIVGIAVFVVVMVVDRDSADLWPGFLVGGLFGGAVLSILLGGLAYILDPPVQGGAPPDPK